MNDVILFGIYNGKRIAVAVDSEGKIITSGGGSGTGFTAAVTDYASLPLPAASTGKYYYVTTTTGGYPIGVYYSDGISWIYNTSYPITVVANYSALPAANTVSGKFYWCSSSQGTAWLPGSLGGTYYNSGLYYSNGTTWEFLNTPYQATQAEVNTGTNNDKFVTPNTFTNANKWNTKQDTITILSPTNGGTGVNNGSRTITIGGDLTFNGAFNAIFTIPRSTTWALPNTASETLAGLGTAQTFTAVQTWNSSVSATAGFAYGQVITGTLTATANSDTLVGLRIAPTRVLGGFTGVNIVDLQANFIAPNTNNTGSLGNSSFAYSSIYVSTLFGGAGVVVRLQTGSDIEFGIASATYAKVIRTTGNFMIQNSGTYTDTGDRLQVQGNIYMNVGVFKTNPTYTTAGTTGNQTINKASGSIRIAAAGTTVTLTNNLITTSSRVWAICTTNDTTAYVKNTVVAAGSVVINLGAAATAEVEISWFVLNN